MALGAPDVGMIWGRGSRTEAKAARNEEGGNAPSPFFSLDNLLGRSSHAPRKKETKLARKTS